MVFLCKCVLFVLPQWQLLDHKYGVGVWRWSCHLKAFLPHIWLDFYCLLSNQDLILYCTYTDMPFNPSLTFTLVDVLFVIRCTSLSVKKRGNKSPDLCTFYLERWFQRRCKHLKLLRDYQVAWIQWQAEWWTWARVRVQFDDHRRRKLVWPVPLCPVSALYFLHPHSLPLCWATSWQESELLSACLYTHYKVFGLNPLRVMHQHVFLYMFRQTVDLLYCHLQP